MAFKMRPPAIPLINVDPYFSIWSPYNCVTDGPTKHWTGKDNNIIGSVLIDGVEYGFLGNTTKPVLKQTNLDITAFTTEFTFENDIIKFYVKFCSPLVPDDLRLMSEPVSYMECKYSSKDSQEHNVEIKLIATEELCLNSKGEGEIVCEKISLDGIACFKMGNKEQNVLSRCGDDIRIDWGYFYLACNTPKSNITEKAFDGMKAIELSVPMKNGKEELIVFAYDDIKSLIYFGKPIEAYWKKYGLSIEEVIVNSFAKYAENLLKCYLFSSRIASLATANGNEKYSEILLLSVRQVMSAHKLAIDENGELVYISKECFSNGCAATVDVTYPSAPLFIMFNTRLLKAMLRPILRYAHSEDWKFPFAPHDLGTYPFCNGQTYFNNDIEHQMPVEECGNMLILMATLAKIDRHYDFLLKNKPLLKQWADYLCEFGLDPANQKCTDDFSGHLAHNCNLSVKAIMGIKGYSIISKCLGDDEAYEHYSKVAISMAEEWKKNASSNNYWYRHTFDSDEGYSLKYNLIWDKLWNAGMFGEKVFSCEIRKYKEELNKYGVPLDQRAAYTKSDWMIWAACLADSKDDFCLLADTVWNTYNDTNFRVPMTDWYDSITAEQSTWPMPDNTRMGFQHRSVQGGLFMKLLIENR